MKKNLKLFLIDDDDDDRVLFFDAVEEIDKDIQCEGVSNGDDALIYLKDETHALPDFIFLDLRMPGISGQNCLIEIKKDPRLANIPVIVYTTSRDLDDSIALKKMGASHFMSKPTSAAEVYYLVSFVINEKWN